MSCSCKSSKITKDALEQAAQLIWQAEGATHFSSEEQALVKLPPSVNVDNSDPLQNTINNTTDFDNTNSKSYCWSIIISSQLKFVDKQPLLQTMMKNVIHFSLFIPKFHCELNPIELFWSYIKDGMCLFSCLHWFNSPYSWSTEICHWTMKHRHWSLSKRKPFIPKLQGS